MIVISFTFLPSMNFFATKFNIYFFFIFTSQEWHTHYSSFRVHAYIFPTYFRIKSKLRVTIRFKTWCKFSDLSFDLNIQEGFIYREHKISILAFTCHEWLQIHKKIVIYAWLTNQLLYILYDTWCHSCNVKYY